MNGFVDIGERKLAMIHFFRTEVLFCVVLATLAIYPIVVKSSCGISSPGQPLVDGIPQCPCGYLYVASVNCVGPIPTQCANCEPHWTTVGCYSTTNSAYHSKTTNIRCSCSSGGCCITSGWKSGMFQPSGYVCNPGTVCANDATCSGTSAACPPQAFKPFSTICRSAGGPCEDPGTCTGSSPTCTISYKRSSAICRNATNICENTSYCSGYDASCPKPLPKPSTTVCRAPQGPCENSVNCTGDSTTCPPPSFKSSTTICGPSGEACFLDAVCPGNGPRCPVKAARPQGSACGNNTACPRFTNNTCNAIGDCLVAECTPCPNGNFGYDCSCPGGPPTSTIPLPLDATCFEGVWTVVGDIIGSLVIEPGTIVVIEGSLTLLDGDTLTLGSGSLANITGCSNITGDLKGKHSGSTGAKEAQLELLSPGCSLVDVTLITTASSNDKCLASTVKKSPERAGLIGLLFEVRNTCNKKNHLAYIVAPTVSVGCVAVLLGVALLLVRWHYRRTMNKFPDITEEN